MRLEDKFPLDRDPLSGRVGLKARASNLQFSFLTGGSGLNRNAQSCLDGPTRLGADGGRCLACYDGPLRTNVVSFCRALKSLKFVLVEYWLNLCAVLVLEASLSELELGSGTKFANL